MGLRPRIGVLGNRRVPGRSGTVGDVRNGDRRRASAGGTGRHAERTRQRRTAQDGRGAGRTAAQVVPQGRAVPGPGALDHPRRGLEVPGGLDEQGDGRRTLNSADSCRVATRGGGGRMAAPAFSSFDGATIRRMKLTCAILVLLVSSAAVARAEVTRVDVARRMDLGASGYEKIVGTIHFAVDPKDPRNAGVADIDKAPVNAGGRVEFSSDLYILRPKAPRGNGAALVDVLNRGNKVVLNGFNRGGSPDPATENDLGDRFLMRFGFTVVWVGWEFDVAAGRENAMRIRVPVAAEHGPLTGIVRATFTANARTNEFSVNDLAQYDAVDPAGGDSQLTVRSPLLGGHTDTIPRTAWHVAGHTVSFDTGF